MKVGDKLKIKSQKTGKLLNFIIMQEPFNDYYPFSIHPISQFCKDDGDCDKCEHLNAFKCEGYHTCIMNFKTWEALEAWVKEQGIATK